jgi:hypothetical protein
VVDTALELSDGAKDMQNLPAACATDIDTLAQGAESHSALFQQIQEVL